MLPLWYCVCPLLVLAPHYSTSIQDILLMACSSYTCANIDFPHLKFQGTHISIFQVDGYCINVRKTIPFNKFTLNLKWLLGLFCWDGIFISSFLFSFLLFSSFLSLEHWLHQIILYLLTNVRYYNKNKKTAFFQGEIKCGDGRIWDMVIFFSDFYKPKNYSIESLYKLLEVQHGFLE